MDRRAGRHRRTRLSRAVFTALLILAVGGAASVLVSPALAQTAPSPSAPRQFQIAAGSLADALDEFGQQSGMHLLYEPSLVKGLRAPAVSGQLEPTQALQRLLVGSGLKLEAVNASTFVLKRDPSYKPATPTVPVKTPRSSEVKTQGKVTELAEILVTGTRSLNTDIERTRDDVQPYVVFHRETIEQSGAASIDDFLKQRLPMNTTALSENQTLSTSGNRSSINLRGLGTNQTLILIDGRRTSNAIEGGSNLLQADLNGIPLAAVERIEVLPTTASGIYGGDATGGVINVILRRDYRGSEVRLTWGNSFDTDSAQPRVDLSTGFNWGDKTNVMITASRSQSNVLLNRDRDFVEDYRRRAFANNPNLYLPFASPPLGYLPNLRSADGSNLVLDDGTPLGSNFTHVPTGYAGGDGGAAMVASAGSYNFGLANSSQGEGGRQALLNEPETTSGNVTIRHAFTPKVEGFLELAASNNASRFIYNNISSEIILPAAATNNPFQQDLLVRTPLPVQDFGRDYHNTERRVTAGVVTKLPGNWFAEVDFVWSRTGLRSVDETFHSLTPEGQAVLADGTLDILRDPNVYPLALTPYLIRPGTIYGPFETTTRSPTFIFGGPMGSLPAGDPQLSLRVEHRDEQFAEATQIDPGFVITLPSKSQTVSSMFAGLTVPVFSSLNARSGLQELDWQLSMRYDRYTVEGAVNAIEGEVSAISSPTDPVTRIDRELNSTNFTTGFRWKPIEDLVLRASYGTGFLPPNVNQLVPSEPTDVSGFPLDPRRGNTPLGQYQFISGGNPGLQPEKSKSLSVGLILTPRFLPGARFSVDYTRIEKTENIAGIPGGFQGLLDNETRFPDRVVRGQSLPGDPPGWAGPVTFLDLTLINVARAEVEAFDVQLDWTRDTARWGSFNIFVVATWQTHYKTQLLDDLPVVENVGFQSAVASSPLKLKANFGATWDYRNWTVGWVSRYFDSYRPYFAGASVDTIASNLQTQGSANVEHQLYHDLTAQYAFDGSDWLGGLGKGLSLQLGIRNVFNKAPPRALAVYSSYGDPRMASYWLTLRKSFN